MVRGGTSRSIDAALVQPRAVGLVELLNVLKIPGRKELEQGTEMNGLIMVDLFQCGIELCQQVPVGSPMCFETGEGLLLQELFLALEVHMGEFDETFELQADGAAVATMEERDAQLIQGVHQDAVLIVHGLYADDALMAPSQQGHCILHNQGQV